SPVIRDREQDGELDGRGQTRDIQARGPSAPRGVPRQVPRGEVRDAPHVRRDAPPPRRPGRGAVPPLDTGGTAHRPDEEVYPLHVQGGADPGRRRVGAESHVPGQVRQDGGHGRRAHGPGALQLLVGDLSTNEGRLARFFRSIPATSSSVANGEGRPTALRATLIMGVGSASQNVNHPPALADSHLENSGEVTAAGGGPLKFATSASKRTEARINRQLIDDIFRGVDPFARSGAVRPDWTYPHTNWQPVFFEHLWTQYVRPNHGTLDFYLEVGSFKGGSITRLADLLKEKCPDWRKVSLVCMDPFSGDVNMWDWNHKGTKFGHDFLDTGPHGRPQIFERFLSNVADKGHQDMVLPIIVGRGLAGMKLIDRFHKTGRIDQLPSVIYLDSAHEKDETFLELEQAWRILRECGAILGDDWAWDAVREDVVRFAEGRNLPALPIYDKYEQKTTGLVLGPKGQWFIVKNGQSCKFDANGTW
ncbi:hypothetical protein THAOC_04788, partial [Thalassiosira oceanica]